MKVLVIGAGIGGLTLAHGLRRHGVAVAVFERDRSPTDRLQGYRIHINEVGNRALSYCLPPDLFAAFLATCGQSNRGIGFFSHHLRELVWFGDDNQASRDPDPIQSVHSVSRISLRQVLLAGLSNVVRFDKSFTHYEIDERAQVVTAHFADGSSAHGDVLVGADGVGSRVRRQYLPSAEPVDTGVVGIQGKVWLSDDTRAILPPRIQHGPMMIPGPGGYGMFLAQHEFQSIPTHVARVIGPQVATQRDFIMWGLLARRNNFATDLEQRDDRALLRLALEHTRTWHPNLRRLLSATDPATLLLTPIRSSVPAEPWPPTITTLLGDAIHSMPPTGGIGANTALRDAELLTRRLTDAARGNVRMLQAIADYENDMRRYGFEAVRQSMRNLQRQQLTENPLMLTLMKAVLWTLGNLRALRRTPPLGRLALGRSSV
jgi:2-polyprenyl-6-methoxyphenol hydroxylase-like FAD-dependent oxidoreductase